MNLRSANCLFLCHGERKFTMIKKLFFPLLSFFLKNWLILNIGETVPTSTATKADFISNIRIKKKTNIIHQLRVIIAAQVYSVKVRNDSYSRSR